MSASPVGNAKVPKLALEDARALLEARRNINQCDVLEPLAREYGMTFVADACRVERRAQVAWFWRVGDSYGLFFVFGVVEIVQAAELDAAGVDRFADGAR